MKSKQENFQDDNLAYIELHNIVWLEQAHIESELMKLTETNHYESLVDINREIKLIKHEILRGTW